MNRPLRILTFNVALLRLQLGRLWSATPTPFLTERLHAIAAQLAKPTHQADLLALQEIYSREDKEWLIEALEEHYPHAFYDWRDTKLALENGLLLLSRLPLERCSFHNFRHKALEEWALSTKGYLLCELRLPGGPEVLLLNVHLTSGGASKPDGARANRIRLRQAHELLAVFAQSKTPYHILLGDFNCGPEADAGTYDFFLQQGYTHPAPAPPPTWEPDNFFNRQSTFQGCPPQTIDHILFSAPLADLVQEANYTLLLRDPILQHPYEDLLMPLSDHSAVALSFTLA